MLRTRLANPDYEPTDEELMELSRAAFAGVRERHQKALEALYEQIADLRKVSLEGGTWPLK
jgi:hypothetical protein